MLHLVGDAVADSSQDIVGDARPIGSHKVIRGNGTNGHQMIVGAMIAHYTHRLDTGKHAEELGHLFLVPILGHLVPQDPIRLLQHLDLIRSDLAQDSHAQTGAGERLAPHQLLGNAQHGTHLAHLVLKQVAQRLYQAQELHILRHLYLIMMGFDGIRIPLAGLNAVRINGALGKVAQLILVTDLVPKHIKELGADDLALLLRVGDALQRLQKALLAVDPHKIHIKQGSKGLFYKIALVLAH